MHFIRFCTLNPFSAVVPVVALLLNAAAIAAAAEPAAVRARARVLMGRLAGENLGEFLLIQAVLKQPRA